MAAARLLLARPALAVLDEATSAVDVAAEAHVYRLLRAQGCAVLSVGHRPSVWRHHATVEVLGPALPTAAAAHAAEAGGGPRAGSPMSRSWSAGSSAGGSDGDEAGDDGVGMRPVEALRFGQTRRSKHKF